MHVLKSMRAYLFPINNRAQIKNRILSQENILLVSQSRQCVHNGLIQISVMCTTDSNEVNTLRPRHNGLHFAEDIFKCNFFNENTWIPIKISPKFVT